MEPMPHQRAMAQRMANEERWGFWNDTGTGKTIGTLLGLDTMRTFPALVLAPKNVVTHAWMEDAKHFPETRVVSAMGTKKQRDRAYRLVHEGGADVLVTGWESAMASKAAIEWFDWKAIVLDESTRIKSHTAKTTKWIHKLVKAKPHARRFALSGYPAPNGRMDLWGQLHFLQPGLLPKTFSGFRHKYFWQPQSSLTWLWKPKVGADHEIDNTILAASSWLRKEDCINIPEQIDVHHEVELQPQERRAYTDFIRDWIIEFGSTDARASTKLVELMKCRQMTAGLVKTGDGQWQEIGGSKLKVIKELVETERGQVMVIAQFRREVERIAGLFGEDVEILYGGIGKQRTDSTIERFRRGAFKVLVCHPGTMSHGLTFTNCSRMIFASFDYNYEQYVQVRDRIHRYGQKRVCVYDHLVAKNTIDEVILGALQGKASVTLDMIAAALPKVTV